MKYIIASLKISLIFLFIGFFITQALALDLFIKNPWKLVRTGNAMISAYSKIGLKILGIKVTWDGSVDATKNHMIVSNHLSYTDILSLAASIPTGFVTSMEIRETPVLGHLCKSAGCLFVERRSRSNLENEVKNITEALNNGVNVTIFPEATSTNGERVLRFRKPLYMAAIQSQTKVLPVCINYQFIDDTHISINNRDKVFWYGDMSFLPHLWNLALHKRIEITIKVLSEIELKETATVDELAGASHLAVSKAYRPIIDHC